MNWDQLDGCDDEMSEPMWLRRAKKTIALIVLASFVAMALYSLLGCDGNTYNNPTADDVARAEQRNKDNESGSMSGIGSGNE